MKIFIALISLVGMTALAETNEANESNYQFNLSITPDMAEQIFNVLNVEEINVNRVVTKVSPNITCTRYPKYKEKKDNYACTTDLKINVNAAGEVSFSK
jgi:hypothetical protein